MSDNNIPYNVRLKRLNKDINRLEVELESLREKLDNVQHDPYSELTIRQQIAAKVDLQQNKLKEIKRLEDEADAIFARMKDSVN